MAGRSPQVQAAKNPPVWRRRAARRRVPGKRRCRMHGRRTGIRRAQGKTRNARKHGLFTRNCDRRAEGGFRSRWGNARKTAAGVEVSGALAKMAWQIPLNHAQITLRLLEGTCP